MTVLIARRQLDIGEPVLLDPTDDSPFKAFGSVLPGQTCPTLYNNLVRAPLFRQKPYNTDFLIVRSVSRIFSVDLSTDSHFDFVEVRSAENHSTSFERSRPTLSSVKRIRSSKSLDRTREKSPPSSRIDCRVSSSSSSRGIMDGSRCRSWSSTFPIRAISRCVNDSRFVRLTFASFEENC